MNNEILIYSKVRNSRTDYIFSYLFADLMGMRWSQTQSMEEAESFEGAVLFYDNQDKEGRICIRPEGLLSETGISGRKIETGVWDGLSILFADDPERLVPFDIFSASFWMISRYEEYLDFSADAFGRFPARESFAFRAGFLDLPVVNLWTVKLADIIKEQYPHIKTRKRKFNWITSIDVDHAWAYRNKDLLKTASGLLTSFLKGKDFSRRLKVLRGLEPDPFNCFDEIAEIHSGIQDKLLFFIQCGIPGKYDLNIHPSNPEWKSLVKKLAGDFKLGLHPSFRSNRNETFLKDEYETLSELVPYKIENSRQHYLKLKIPDTYRNLLKLGIRNDYSMGYPGQPGFRAGLCTPFYFYDLLREEQTELKIWPITLMDRTLKDYLHKVPEESIDIINTYVEIVEKAGGWFIPVWHNESLSDYGEWEGWKKIYLRMLEILKSKSS
ncbi:MAG: polysaccharide deacetylase family protein [Bacteroidales bacterium]|nr:polysaccharide deacetylase family protein [Bacteroidales bacterium]